MIAVGGSECTFLALVLSGEATEKKDQAQSIVRAKSSTVSPGRPAITSMLIW